jgi:hypothetical protein
VAQSVSAVTGQEELESVLISYGNHPPSLHTLIKAIDPVSHFSVALDRTISPGKLFLVLSFLAG